MLLAGGAAAAALALTGCSAGMHSQTAEQVAPVPGFSADGIPADGQGNIALRDAVLVYPGEKGYAAGADAPLLLRVFNDTEQPVTLDSVTSNDAAGVKLGSAADAKATPSPSAAAASPTASPAASPSVKATPSPAVAPSPSAAPTAAPAKITIQPGGYVELTPAGGQFFTLTGLKKAVPNGAGVHLKLTFSNGAVIETRDGTVVPVAPPMNPVPRVPVSPSAPAGKEGH